MSLSLHEEPDEPEDPDGLDAAALLVESWVNQGTWAKRLVFCYDSDPLTYYGHTAPDRPSALVTFTLPASEYDSVASRH